MSQSASKGRAAALSRLMQPRSVAIIGMSTKPSSAGHLVLRNLVTNSFPGDIFLVGRSDGEVEGRPILTDVAALPLGIDLAIVTVPAAAVASALAGCAARQVGAAVVFASGFAETGEVARAEQERLGQLAREAGMVVVGPNCIGYVNFRAGFNVAFVSVNPVERIGADVRDAVAIIAQSGGLGNHFRLGLNSRGVPVSYNVSTGNEMDLGLADFVRFMVRDEATRVILLYSEHIRKPQAFLEAAEEARNAGKPIVLMHPGRGVRAREAAQSHTGALAGDHAVMSVMMERAGVVMVDTLDELLDVTEILARYPRASPGQLGVLTFSGAFCGIVHDFCDDLGWPIPPLSDGAEARLAPLLPAFIPPKNPLDLGTEAVWRPDLVGQGVAALIAEREIGGVAISIPSVSQKLALAFLEGIAAASRGSDKPVVLSILGDGSPLPDSFAEKARADGVIVSRSADRVIRALHRVLSRSREPERVTPDDPVQATMPPMRTGVQPEWLGKKVLACVGIQVPDGRLARTVEEAATAAAAIGYPVVIKAQSAALAHKTEAGGVLLNLASEEALRAGWETLNANVARVQPDLELEGILVEAMSARGIELVIGGRRDPQWGPVLLVGLGGVMVEALGDVRLLAPDASKKQVVEALGQLKAAKLLIGFRNMPPADLDAVADVAVALGRLLLAHPQISEIEINPLMVLPPGRGAVALDALIVTS